MSKLRRTLAWLAFATALACSAPLQAADAGGAHEVDALSVTLAWTLLAGFLVMFMQAGFALVETGLCRAKNSAHVMATKFLVYGIGILGFWVCGFAIMFGGYGNGPMPINWQPPLGHGLALLNVEHFVTIAGRSFGLMGGKGFFFNPAGATAAVMAFFLFQMVFMNTAATIPTGAMAERWNFKNFVLYGFWVAMAPYAFFGNWVWGGGWLAQLGVNFGLGHGHVDFAGSSVVHMAGGVIGLAGSLVLGARIGKFRKDGRINAMPSHNIPMVMLGTFILAFGWFGFNSGAAMAGAGGRIALIAVNTMLAGAAASFCTTILVWNWFGKPDPSMMCNGLLAGLVASAAPCAFVSPTGALIIGAIAGIIVVVSVVFIERTLRVDDPVGAISVHGVCGAWGALSVGLFANGSYGAGWAGVHTLVKDGVIKHLANAAAPATIDAYNKLVASGWADQGVTGVFGKLFGGAYNDWSQLGAQIIGTLTCFVFLFAFAFVWFKISNLFVPIRSKAEDEVAGLDVPEMGAEAYPDFHISDRTTPGR